jgi:Uma2 family endonuclease
MVMPQVEPWTRQSVLALPDDGNRYELFGGELLVTPSPAPRHQAVVAALSRRLGSYLHEGHLGHVYTSPADLPLDGNQVAQPDLFVILGPTIGNLTWEEVPLPVLAIEVLSPSTARYDRQVKRSWYPRTGIEYWIVDPDGRVMERWRATDQRPDILDKSLRWEPGSGIDPLNLNLEDLFQEALGPVHRP